MEKDQKFIEDMKNIVSDREKEKEKRILAEKELNITKRELNITKKEAEITKKDLENLQFKMNQNTGFIPSPGPMDQQEQIIEMRPIINQQQIPPQKKPIKQDINKRQIAAQIHKDSKTTMIICLLAILMPFMVIIISMINNMVSMLIALITMIYPTIILAKMISLQSKLSKKYGFRPTLQFKPQPRQNFYQQQPRRIYDNQENMI